MSLGGSSRTVSLSTTFVNGGKATASTPTTTTQAVITSHGARTTNRTNAENASMPVGVPEALDGLARVDPSLVWSSGGGSGVTACRGWDAYCARPTGVWHRRSVVPVNEKFSAFERSCAGSSLAENTVWWSTRSSTLFTIVRSLGSLACRTQGERVA
jgi:hypothetical protein